MDSFRATEVIAESLFIWDFALASFIGLHLVNQVIKLGWRGMWDRLGNRAASAVAIHMTGLGLIRGWSTLMYWMLSHDEDPTVIEDAYPIPLVGLVLAAIGMAACIRIFSPPQWGNWGWAITFIVTALFVGYMQWT